MTSPSRRRLRRSPLGACLGVVALIGVLSGCSGSEANGPTGPTPAASSLGAGTPSSSATSTSSSTSTTSAGTPPNSTTGATSARPSPSISEPTTTNTLPAPPDPTKAAASTAGSLKAAVLPVPAGWHTVVKKGDQEEGFRGNGTWVHARDPRYAATDTITIGCAEVTRDDFTDPTSALEGSYQNGSGQPGVGLAMQFGTAAAASHYLDLYRSQVEACTDPDGPMTANILTSPLGLIDHRTYPGGDDWTEVVKLKGRRVTLIALTDPGHRISRSRAEAILRSIRS